MGSEGKLEYERGDKGVEVVLLEGEVEIADDGFFKGLELVDYCGAKNGTGWPQY
jgi:hypothetical protein